MSWSTREVAELAGITLRAVRHYHHIGLLAEPERRPNGYKQYGVTHLIRLLRIRRLVDRGVPLARIAELGDDDHDPQRALRHLDSELAATAEQLHRVRTELSLLLERGAPAGSADDELSEADRSVVVVMTRVLGPRRDRLADGTTAAALRELRGPGRADVADQVRRLLGTA